MYFLTTILKLLPRALDRTGRFGTMYFATNTLCILSHWKKRSSSSIPGPSSKSRNWHQAPGLPLQEQRGSGTSTVMPSCSGICILGQGCCAVVSPHWGPTGSHHTPLMPGHECFLQKKYQLCTAQFPNCLGSLVPSLVPLILFALVIGVWQQPNKMITGQAITAQSYFRR